MRASALVVILFVLVGSRTATAANQDAIARQIEKAGGKVVRQSVRKLGNGIVSVELPARKQVDGLLEALRGCPELRRLELSSCNIGDDGWAALSRLTGLEELLMIDLSLPDKGLAILANLKRLRKLDVGRGAITSSPWPPPRHPLVRERGILTTDDIVQLAKLPSLEWLGLHQLATPIRKEGWTVVAALPKLRRLDLRGRVTDDDLASIGKAKALEEIQLGSTDVSDEGLTSLTNLKTLREFSYFGGSLQTAKVTDVGLKTLTKLDGLTTLKLVDAPITDAGLEQLAQFRHLKEIDLSRTLVTDTGLLLLKELPALRVVTVFGDKVTPAGRAALRKALPECVVLPAD